MFERLGARLDTLLLWPAQQLWRLRRWYLRRTCHHLSYAPDWWPPLNEVCVRCGHRRTKPGWEQAVMVFEGMGPWEGDGGMIGWGPRWTVYRDQEEADRAKLARRGGMPDAQAP